MDEALKKLKACVDDLDRAIPAVIENAVKNRKSYKMVRDRAMDAVKQLGIIRHQALESFNKIWYSTHQKKGKKNA